MVPHLNLEISHKVNFGAGYRSAIDARPITGQNDVFIWELAKEVSLDITSATHDRCHISLIIDRRKCLHHYEDVTSKRGHSAYIGCTSEREPVLNGAPMALGSKK